MLKAEGQPTPLAPAQRMMLSAQVRARPLGCCMCMAWCGVLLVPGCQQSKGGCAVLLYGLSECAAPISCCFSHQCLLPHQTLTPAPAAPLAPAPPMQNPSWCYTCNIYKPIRTKHCSTCDRHAAPAASCQLPLPAACCAPHPQP